MGRAINYLQGLIMFREKNTSAPSGNQTKRNVWVVQLIEYVLGFGTADFRQFEIYLPLVLKPS